MSPESCVAAVTSASERCAIGVHKPPETCLIAVPSLSGMRAELRKISRVIEHWKTMSDQIIPVTVETIRQCVHRQAETDEHLIQLWLHGRSPQTQRGYGADAKAFLGFVGKPLSEATPW